MTSYQIPGYGYEEIQLAKAQQKMGHDVFIVASSYLHPQGIFYGVLRERFPNRRVAPGEEDQDGVRVVRLAAHEVGRRVWIRGLDRTVARLRPDIVHSHNVLQFHTPRLALLNAWTRHRFGLVVDDHMHRSVMRRTLSGRIFYGAYRRLLGPVVGRGVDRYCAISEETRDYLIGECGIRAPIEIMPLGVDTDAFAASAERRRELRDRLNLPDSDLVVLYTGKIIPAKGPHVLVRAALNLLDEGLALNVLCVGDADQPYLASIRNEIAARGRSASFQFLPSVPHDRLPEVYAGADVAVWPRQESMAVFEAMATALPVVVSAGSGYAAMIESSAGLTFREDDETALAGRLRELSSSTLRQKLGSCGHSLAERNYSWRRSAERYLELYMQVLQRVKTA